MRLADGENARLLSVEKIVEILSSGAFDGLQGKRLYKEQQFLVSLPVKDTYGKKTGENSELLRRDSGEEMLFQGAIDLLAIGENEVEIIDYKYSQKNAENLKKTYSLQLQLYKKAVARVLKMPESSISCTIVNIFHGFEVAVD